jgi:hypothetical protein
LQCNALLSLPCLYGVQTVNGSSKPDQRCAVKDEIDADRNADKVSAGSTPGGQEIDAERDRNHSGRGGLFRPYFQKGHWFESAAGKAALDEAASLSTILQKERFHELGLPNAALTRYFRTH